MSRVDCSLTLNYVKEKNRMCEFYDKICIDCPLYMKKCCSVYAIKQSHIDIVQEWSDKNPQQTRKDKFIQMCKDNGFGDFFHKNCLSNHPYCKKDSCGFTNCSVCKKWWNEVVS